MNASKHIKQGRDGSPHHMLITSWEFRIWWIVSEI